MCWIKVTGEGNPPSPRDKLCSVAMGAKMLLFGGFGPMDNPDHNVELAQAEFTWFNDLYAFDTGEWVDMSQVKFKHWKGLFHSSNFLAAATFDTSVSNFDDTMSSI